MELKQAVSMRISELLKERSYSQRKLATQSGLSPSTINTILNVKHPAV